MDIDDFFWYGMARDLSKPLDPTGHGFRINLGYGAKEMPDGVESIGLPEWDAETQTLPYPDSSVCEIWALHFFEHITNFVPLMAECQRVLDWGGVLNICVPYGSGHMAIQDPTHVRFFNEDTWKHLFECPFYEDTRTMQGKVVWLFRVHLNVIMGVKGENLALLTQLVKETS